MTEREMSFGAALSSSPGSLFSPVEWTIERAACTQVTLQDAAAQLPGAFADLRTQLLHTHEGMRQLFVKCDAVGQCVQRCTDALLRLETSPTGSFAAASDRASSGSAAAIGTSQRQLCWSLAQYHTHVARLLSADNVRAYDTAVSDKIANRLKLLERGAATLQRCVAGVGAAQRPGEKVGGGSGVVWGSAQQLEQLARTRFAPAYEGFLLYAVATLGDFCDVWDTAAQRSAEEVAWSSGKERACLMATPMHAEHYVGAKGSKKAAKAAATSPGTKTPPKGKSKTLRTSSLSGSLSAAVEAALHAVEDLRDALFNYVRLLHVTAHLFSVAATALVHVLTAVSVRDLDDVVSDCVDRTQVLDATLVHARTSMNTRRACYESILEESVLQPLRQLQADSRTGVRLDLLFDAVNYPLMEKTSAAVERTLRRLTKPQSKESRAAHRSSRSSSDFVVPSSPLEVLCDVWCKTTGLCMQIGAEVSEEFTQRVNV